MSGVVNLLTNEGAALGVDVVGDWQTWFGGPGDFWVWGDLGGGTVELEATLDGTAFTCINGTSTTATSSIAAGITKFYLNHGTKIRAALRNTTSTSSGVYAKVN